MLGRVHCVLGVCLFVASSATPVLAQERGAPSLPLVETSAGYAFMRDTTIEENFPAGWYFSAATNVNHWFGVAGEVSGAHKTLTSVGPIGVKANLYTFMAGPRLFVRYGRIVPFAEVLMGAAYFRSEPAEAAASPDGPFTDTKFALQPGGGVTVLLTQNVSVRGAVNYRRIVFTDGDDFEEDESQVRATAGVVFGWGTR